MSARTARVTGSMRANWPKSAPRKAKRPKRTKFERRAFRARRSGIFTGCGRKTGSEAKTLLSHGGWLKTSLVKQKPSSAAEPALSQGLRRYVYFTAAVTGAAI